MQRFLAVICGGAIGAGLRYTIALWANRHGGIFVPYGTIIVNLMGSFCMGLLMVYFNNRPDISPLIKLFVITGILGGLTTFSTFNAELLTLIQIPSYGPALLYGTLNIIAGLFICWIGTIVGQLFYY